MRQKVYVKKGMKLDIHTGHREFDRHCVDVSSCAAMGAAQFSGVVRSISESESGQHYDLYSWFSDIPDYIRQIAKKYADANNGIMLHTFHHHGEHGKIEHGCVIVKERKILAKIYAGPTKKSDNIIDVVAEYLGDCDDNTKYHWAYSVPLGRRIKPSPVV